MDSSVTTRTPETGVTHDYFVGVKSRVLRWLEEVPLYKTEGGRRKCQGPDLVFEECFRKLPLISKEDIRRGFPGNFLRGNMVLQELIDRELVELERTSGTSEEPTPLLLERGWWNRQEREALELNPQVKAFLKNGDRRVTIASPTCSSEICYTGTPSPEQRTLGNALFVNLSRHPFLWSTQALERMLEETLDWSPVFLDVDPVYGAVFARYCAQHNIRIPSLKFILASYEYVSVLHRRILEETFDVPVYNLYGSTETGHLLMDDGAGGMLPSSRTAYLELLDIDPRGVGRLVVTTLTNDYMPLIRYDIGDLVRIIPTRSSPVYEVHGRTKDSIVNTRGGRITVADVDRCFASVKGILHYQLRQSSPDHFTLILVPDHAGCSDHTLHSISGQMHALQGAEVHLELRQRDHVQCENSGKYRLLYPMGSR